MVFFTFCAFFCAKSLGDILSLSIFALQIFEPNVFINNLKEVIMNKTDLIAKIAEGAGLSKVDAKKALDATIEAIAGAVKAGDKVALVGFGTFDIAERAERQGINPATKETITIPAKKVVKFKAGADLAL